jgi:hypothetical protein
MATNQSLIAQPRPNVKQINYSAKTFSDFKQNLIEFTKAYFPNTYSDFNEASPGMMFIEMASYLGDVLSFYIDNQFKENLMAYTEQQENIISIAQFLGYKPKLSSPATVEAQVYQIAPAILDGSRYVPDPKALLKIGKGSIFSSNTATSVTFKSLEDVDFSNITEENYIVNRTDGTNPLDFLITKNVKLMAAEEKLTTFTFGSANKFSTVTLPDEQIIGVESVTDSSGNTWYEVDYLAQDVIMDDVNIVDNNEPGLLPPSGLRLRKVPRRFTTRITRDFRTQLLFGSGIGNDDVDSTLDSRQIANAQYGSNIKNILGNVAINNVNFLNSNAFGMAPANTTLTVKYLVGGGVESNVPSNPILNVINLILKNDTTQYTSTEQSSFNAALQTLTVANALPATGGGDGDSIEEIRQNALGYFNAQNRVVTAQDYVIRTYSLPTKYGTVAKAYALRDEQLNQIMTFDEQQYVQNQAQPNSVNLYTLGFDSYGKLTTLNTIIKNNLARYLEQYRMLTDDINILDAFIINVGVNFEISVFKNYNINDVLARSIGTIQNFFDINKWSINQPIILSDLSYAIGSVDGVKTIKNLTIVNKYQFKDGPGYQNYKYDIAEATIDDVIYPSLDPSIFELKYPQNDIIGSATQ